MATTTQYATATSYSIYDHSPIKENTFEKILNEKLMDEVKSPDNLTKEAAIHRAQSQHVSMPKRMLSVSSRRPKRTVSASAALHTQVERKASKRKSFGAFLGKLGSVRERAE